MDIEMEEKDGIDAVAGIMDLYPQAKIVMLTVQEEDEVFYHPLRQELVIMY